MVIGMARYGLLSPSGSSHSGGRRRRSEGDPHNLWSSTGRDEHVNEAKGHICPQCGAPRAADGSPSCACTQRASDALRDARTAEAAAAEDFDPLRIRPYVELDGNPQEQTPAPAPPTAPEGETQRLPHGRGDDAAASGDADTAPGSGDIGPPDPDGPEPVRGRRQRRGPPEHPTDDEDPRAAATAAPSSSPSRGPSWRWPRWRVSRAACSRTSPRRGTRRPPRAYEQASRRHRRARDPQHRPQAAPRPPSRRRRPRPRHSASPRPRRRHQPRPLRRPAP